MSIHNVNALYHPDIFHARQTQGWDEYSTRLARYEVLDGYYHNLQYHRIRSYAQSLKVHEQLYKHVRGVYNPTKRVVDGYVAKVYGGHLDIKEAKTGAIPIITDSETLRDSITQLWADSQWGQKKSLYVRYGAKLGDSFIKVVDDIHIGQVRIEVIDPSKIKSVKKDSDGTIVRIEFEYFIRIENELVKYREIITPEKFFARTERNISLGDQKPETVLDSIHINGRGEAIGEWDNEYGFVPVIHTLHIDEGLKFGASSIHGTTNKINELNDLASLVNDGQRRQVNMPMVSINAKVGAIDFGSDKSDNEFNQSDNPKKDTTDILELTGGGDGKPVDFKTLSPTINIADAIVNINNIQAEIERDMPELSLHRLREGGNLTAPGVRSAYDDAIARYQEARGTYNTGLIKAQSMAIAIGGMRGYKGYEGFNLMSLEDDSLIHQVQERPVINETLSILERQQLTLSGMQQSAPKIFFVKMGWGDKEAEEIIEAAQGQRNSFMQTLPFGSNSVTQPLDDPDADEKDTLDQRQNTLVNEADVLTSSGLLDEV